MHLFFDFVERECVRVLTYHLMISCQFFSSAVHLVARSFFSSLSYSLENFLDLLLHLKSCWKFNSLVIISFASADFKQRPSSTTAN